MACVAAGACSFKKKSGKTCRLKNNQASTALHLTSHLQTTAVNKASNPALSTVISCQRLGAPNDSLLARHSLVKVALRGR
jgi:hypothetical protein